MIPADEGSIDDLVVWLRGFAPMTAAPAGQPDAVHENLTELLMWLGQLTDYMKVEPRISRLKDSVAQHNADVRARCERIRNEPVPCGGTIAARCATCPRTRGLSLHVSTLK